MHNSPSRHKRIAVRSNRSSSGQAALALNIVIGVFVIGMLFTFVYEFTRFLLAREQLKTIVQSSALAGEATILSSTQTTSSARAIAQQTALNIFQRNAILGTLLSKATLVSSPALLSPAAGQTQLAIEWVDPITRATTSPTSSVLRLTAAYNYALFSANFLSTKAVAYTMSVSEIAALPKVDLVVLLDESGSMDDQTSVTNVQRIWDYSQPGTGSISYVPNPGGGGAGTLASIACAAPMGTALNALPPQNLESGSLSPPTTCPKYFSEIGYPNNPNHQTRGLRGVSNTGSPPGNGPIPPAPPPPGAPPLNPPPMGPALGPFGLSNGTNPAKAGGQNYNANTNLEYLTFDSKSGPRLEKLSRLNLDLLEIFSGPMLWEQVAQAQGAPVAYPADMFTDMVVNLDGNPTFQGFTSPDGYSFPNAATLLEAARGNLENPTVSYLSGATSSGLRGVARSGYQASYILSAAQQILPQAVVHSSTSTFMNKLINSTDAHFGLVAFSDRAGLAPNDVYQNYNVSWAYQTAGANNFPLPAVTLSPSANNYTAIQSWVTPPTTVNNFTNIITVNGGTNTADALKNGLDQLTNPALVRYGSMKAIVLVTDGVPSRDINDTTAYLEGANGQAQSDAVAQAQRAKAAGIPIYIVALAQDPSTIGPAEDLAYSETVPGSIANTVGFGSKYYRVNWVSRANTQTATDATFGNIARQFTSLIR